MRPENKLCDPSGLSFIEKARRAQIVEAGIDTIATLGYAHASLAQIARRAGISKGVISYHFTGKEALIHQIVMEVSRAAGAYMSPRIEAETSAADRLRVYIESNLSYMRSHRKQMLALLEIWSNLRPKDGASSHLAAMHENAVGGLEHLLREGQEAGVFRPFSPRTMAMVIRKAIDEVTYQVATQDDFDLDSYSRELVTLFDRATRRDKVAAKATVFLDPQTSRPVADQTRVFLLYDKVGLYVAFHCQDSQPDSIVARETVRDAILSNDDNVGIDLDAFRTYKYDDYSLFTVNALGTRSSRLGGGRAGKLEWQGDWQAAAKRTKDGWTAEMRIPWAILSYPNSDKPLSLGINFHRWQQRTQIQSYWSDLGPQRFGERQGVLQDVEVPVKGWRPRFSALPYFMPSLHGKGGHSQSRSGLDLRLQPTPELTAVATLNPDFASVEGAIESINFSRSERFVPDDRPFFLEGRDYFEIGESYKIGNLFNSGRIGQVDTGVKLYGKITPRTTLGMLSTFAPGKQNNIVTQIRQELGPTANITFQGMQRLAPGQDNTVLAVTPNVRWGKWSLDAEGALTMGPGAGGAAWSSAVIMQDKNFIGSLRFRSVEQDFKNRLGFIPFVDYKGLWGYFSLGSPWRQGFLRSYKLELIPTWDWHQDGRPFRRQATFKASVETRSDYRFGIQMDGGKFNNDSDFTYGLHFQSGVTNRFRSWGGYLFSGQLSNLPFMAYGANVSFRLGKSVDLLYSGTFQNYQGFTQQHILTLNYQIDPFRAWGGRMVIQNSAVNFYLSYRNAGRRGMDTYVILGDPNANSFVQRVMVKFVYAL